MRRYPTTQIRSLLTIEIIERIADFLFEIQTPNQGLCNEGDSFCSTKTPWPEVEGFMYASLDLHNMGIERWVSVLTIRESGDWKIAARWSQTIRWEFYYA